MGYGLIFFNLFLSQVHFGQFAAQIALSVQPNQYNKTIEITRTVIAYGSPWNNTGSFNVTLLGYVHPMWMSASFFAITAVFHLVTVCFYLSRIQKQKGQGEESESSLGKGGKKTAVVPKWEPYHIRWTEYAITSTIMVCLLGLMLGIGDICAILPLAGCNIAMILFGLISDNYRTAREIKKAWTPFFYGCFIGGVPWIALFVQLGLSKVGDVPTVGPIVVSMIVVTCINFFSFAAIALYGLVYDPEGERLEWMYAFASLVAKSFLAWIIFGAFIAG